VTAPDAYFQNVHDVQDVTDPDDPRLDDFRDLNSVDRRPDLPTGKGLVIAEGVLVVQRMLASRFTPHAMLGTDRRLAELQDDLAGADTGRAVQAPYYRASADVMAQVVGFHLNRGVLAAARRVLGTRRGWAWTRWCSAAAAPIRCTAAPSGCRWVTYCWCRMRVQWTGPPTW
jgi:hypothetical protein